MGEIFGLVIVRPFGLILMAIFTAVKSYGLSVLLFALIVKLILIPLGLKSKKNMMAMTAMQSEMQSIQKKYANNRVKMNEEIQKLYDKHGVNPMTGCLPQFIQLPIMMGLYYAVQQPLKFMLGFGDDVIAKLAQVVGVDVAQAGYYGQITIAEKLNQLADASGNFPDNVMQIVQGTSGTLVPIDFHFLGLNLAQIPSIKEPGVMWLIPILSGATAFLSSYVMQKMQGTNNSQAATQMKMMNIMMPLMSLYFGFILPGAIGIYWIFNNVLTCIQEVVMTKYYRGKQQKASSEAERLLEEEKAAKREANRAVQQSQNEKKKKGDK
ncbi:YidC/Oxa1 family membrane protein insertase [Agathobaculum sp.]|uniref:YidC/Oxa1 family membrane protein insertase n=1 Tax=Agathobaculum sp. TaxID=2048138 RepID=UPI002A80A114|nr:YidC/Oxa1 family membrane protein insertase [Agathobaculum sp.]MDY3618440.1 YidC/Oxa1 family membrane protein insertase [Agathobaculum sp.]